MQLHIVGTGTLENYVKSFSSRFKGIMYHGGVPDTKLAEIYRNCDIFVFPSKGEAFGFAALEALSSGMTLLVSDDLKGIFDEFADRGYVVYMNRANIGGAMLAAAQNIYSIRQARTIIHEFTALRYGVSTMRDYFYEALRGLIRGKNNRDA